MASMSCRFTAISHCNRTVLGTVASVPSTYFTQSTQYNPKHTTFYVQQPTLLTTNNQKPPSNSEPLPSLFSLNTTTHTTIIISLKQGKNSCSKHINQSCHRHPPLLAIAGLCPNFHRSPAIFNPHHFTSVPQPTYANLGNSSITLGTSSYV